MSNLDIIARLQLNAEQFSSETGKRFAEMKQRAGVAADEVRKPFVAAFADVQRQAQQALNLPRTKTGALDLSQEIANLRESAAGADLNAAALRDLANAKLTVANASQTDAAGLRLEADAAMVAAHAAEAAAKADRDRIVAIEAVQAQLNRTTSATGAHTSAINRNTASAGQQRAAMQQLGFQINDIATGIGSGTPYLQIFAQQTGQVTQALGMMSKSGKGVLGFLGGPWGAILTAATVVLVPMIGKMLEFNDATDDAVKKMKADADATEINRQAKQQFAASVDGVRAAIRAQTQALKEGAESERSAAERANILARANYEAELAIRQRTKAQLESAIVAKRDLESSAFANTDPRAAQIAKRERDATVATLTDQLKQADADLAQARTNYERSRSVLAAEQSKRQMDPNARIDQQYDAEIRAAQQAAEATGHVTNALKKQIDAINVRRKAAHDAEAERERAAKRADKDNQQFGRPISAEDAAGIVRAIGGQVNSISRSYAQQKALYDAWVKAGKPADNPVAKPGTSAHERGNALDVQMTPDMSVKKLREAFEREGVRLTKVFAERGHWHIEWTKSADAVRDATNAAREAAKAQKELDGSLAQIENSFDPAAAAARRYREEIAKINELAGAGRITTAQQIDYADQARAAYVDATRKAQLDNFRRIMGPEAVDDVVNSLSLGVNAAGDDWREKAVKGAREAGDNLRAAVGDAAAMLGIRVGGPLSAMLQPGGIEGQADGIAKRLVDNLSGVGIDLSDKSAEKLKGILGSVLAGASYGQIGGSVFSSITGGRNDSTASAIGGVLGEVGGKALSKTISSTIGGALGQTLGSAAGPIGAIAGGILGNLVSGLFTSQKWASATVGLVNGQAVGNGANGKGGSQITAATGAASSLAKGINSVVDALGAQITGLPGITIGSWDGKARVALTSTNQALHYNNFTSATLKDFGKDGQQAALEYAVAYSVSHAVLTGISQASKNIIAKGSDDIEGAIQKALLIEAIPRDLKAMVDPVGAAIDELNRKWIKTKAALDEGGASTEQMAQAQRLYQMQLDQIKASTASASQTLKDFLTTLNIGSSSPLSLRDQEVSARAQLAPFLSAIETGQAIDQGKYQDAAKAFLDIERQLYGSSSKFFEAFDAVQAATNKAISTIDNAAPVSTPVESPFVKATASSTAATASGVQTGNEIASQNGDLLQDAVRLLQQIANGSSVGGGSFIGAARNFSVAAA